MKTRAAEAARAETLNDMAAGMSVIGADHAVQEKFTDLLQDLPETGSIHLLQFFHSQFTTIAVHILILLPCGRMTHFSVYQSFRI